MYDLDSISNFTESIFDLYGMNKMNFFYSFDSCTNQLRATPLFPYKDSKSVSIVVERVAKMLGLETSILFDMNRDAASVYWDRYPFFRLYKYIIADNSRLSEKIKLNAHAIKQRLIHYLREIDVLAPGTFHESAHIIDLTVETREFISFPAYKEMVESLLNMYQKAEKLFFLCAHGKPTEDDIREYNFLSHWLELQDQFIPNTIVDYDYIMRNKAVFDAEQYTSLIDYVKSIRLLGLEFWRFKEFSEDRELAQKLLNIIPGAKHSMRQFSILTLNYNCFFRWSDDPPPKLSWREISELHEYEDTLELEHKPLNEIPSDPITLYLPKTTEELGQNKDTSNRLKSFCSPPSLGGLSCSDYSVLNTCSKEKFDRLLRRRGVR